MTVRVICWLDALIRMGIIWLEGLFDDFDAITDQLRQWVADKEVDVIAATGGTGLTGRDGSPEAFRSIFEKEIEGFGELFRYISYTKIGTSTIQSRAVAGVAGGTISSRFRLTIGVPRWLG